MTFSGLKQKFRRAVMTGLFMLGALTGCNRSSAPQEGGAPEGPAKQQVEMTTPPLAPLLQEEEASPETAIPLQDKKTVAPPVASRTIWESSPTQQSLTFRNGGWKLPSHGFLFAPRSTVPLLPSFRTGFPDMKKEISLLQNHAPAYVPFDAGRLNLGLRPDACAGGGHWKLKVYASHAFTHYFPSDIRIKTSRYDVTIKGYEWVERGSRDFFLPKTWSKPGNNPFQVLDEPSNAYTLSFEKGKDVIFLSHFHPKFYQDPDQISHIKGKIDGVDVDHIAPVNQSLHGGYQLPGAMMLEDNKNTYLQMEFEAGYGRRFNVVSTRHFGKITYVPAVSAGVQMGRTRSAIVEKEGGRKEYNESFSLHGVGGSIRNKIEWTSQNERIGLFYENKTSLYHRKHDLLDGTQEFNFCYTANNVGFTFSLYNSDRQKHAHKPPRF